MPGGRPTKYDPEFHPQDCERLGLAGKFRVQMAKEWSVDTTTIGEWIRTYPEFSLAYNKACNYRTAWLIEQGQAGLFGSKDCQLNATAWSMMMRYDGGNTDERTVRVPELSDCKTFTEMSQCLIKAFGDGRLTPKEANTLADLISKSAKVDEITELRSMLEAIKEARG